MSCENNPDMKHLENRVKHIEDLFLILFLFELITFPLVVSSRNNVVKCERDEHEDVEAEETKGMGD